MAYYGKQKCKLLKQIRAEIAKNNDIAYTIEECKHKGNCLGTCPKCEAEVAYLEKQLEMRKKAGKTVALVGIAAGLSLAVTGCVPDPTNISGNMVIPDGPETTEQTQTTETTSPTDPLPLQGDIVVDGEFPLPPETEETDIPDEPLMGEPALYPWEETDETTEFPDTFAADNSAGTTETNAKIPDVKIDVMGMMVGPDGK